MGMRNTAQPRAACEDPGHMNSRYGRTVVSGLSPSGQYGRVTVIHADNLSGAGMMIASLTGTVTQARLSTDVLK